MRLWPKTPRGTWLLAGLAWATACAGAWAVLPVRPRADWQFPHAVFLVGFTPDGAVLTLDWEADTANPSKPDDYPRGPLRAWDAATGRPLQTLPVPPHRLNQDFLACRFSPDGRWLALPGGGSVWLADLRAGTVARLPGARPKFSGDSRRLAHTAAAGDAILVTDLSGLGEVVAVRGADPFRDVGSDRDAFALSPDGSRLAAVLPPARAGRLDAVGVFDIPAGRWLWTTLVPGRDVMHLRFSDDGSFLAAECMADGTRSLAFWRAGDGGPLAVGTPAERGVFAGGGAFAAVRLGTPGRLYPLDLSGREPRVRAAALEADADCGYEYETWPVVGPAGRIVALGTEAAPALPLAAWAERAGLPWPAEAGGRREGVDLLDAETGRRLGRVPGAADFLAWSRGDRLLAIPDAFYGAHRVTIWDVPPRKPLSWFLPLAALLAIPPAWLARRRGRRLRRGAG